MISVPSNNCGDLTKTRAISADMININLGYKKIYSY